MAVSSSRRRPWRTRLWTGIRQPEVDRPAEGFDYAFQVQCFEGMSALFAEQRWIDAPLTKEARDNLFERRGCKGWRVRLNGKPCGIVVRFSGDDVHWPYARSYAMPLTERVGGPVTFWSCNLLVVSQHYVDTNFGDLAKGLAILADQIANPPRPAIMSRQDANDLATLF